MDKILIIAVLLTLLSCQKAQRDEDVAVNTCEDIFLAQSIFADAYKHIRIAAQGAEGISDASSTTTSIHGCEEIIVDTTSSVPTITIDFKFIGCEGFGAVRYGRLIGEFFGKFGEANSAVDMTFSNYYFEEFEVDGKIRVIFDEVTTPGVQTHTFYVQSGSVNDGSSELNWTANQNWTVTTSGTSESYSFTGNSNGSNRRGNLFASEITSANLMTRECIYTTAGGKDVNVRNLSLRKLDFGNSECNASARATINGAEYDVSFPD
jgi:hypothetical protein